VTWRQQKLAVIMEHEFHPGRWLVCRRAPGAMPTVEVECLSLAAAEDARRRLQSEYDMGETAPILPGEMRQIALGFYTDADAA